MTDDELHQRMREARPAFSFPSDFQRKIWGRIEAAEIRASISVVGSLWARLVRWKHRKAEHRHGHDYPQHGADGHQPELEWLRGELQVTEAQMEDVRALRVAYHPVCKELTHRLETSHRSLSDLTTSATGVTPEMEAALKEHEAVHLECRRAMLKHFYETAACLSREQARRYLDRMIPFVLTHDSAGSSGHSH